MKTNEKIRKEIALLFKEYDLPLEDNERIEKIVMICEDKAKDYQGIEINQYFIIKTILESLSFRISKTKEQGIREKLDIYKEAKDKGIEFTSSSRYYKDINFYVWACKVRKLHEKGALPSDLEAELMDIDFPLNRYSKTWDESYAILIDFIELNKKGPSSNKYYKGCNIGKWVSRQKKAMEVGSLSPLQVDKMNKVKEYISGSLAGVRNKEDIWNKMFFQYTRTRQKGDKRPEGLTEWMYNQRRLKKEGLLPQDKIQKLNKHNFDWDIKDLPSWEETYEHLKEYLKHNDIENIKENTVFNGINIGVWIYAQRSFGKRGILSNERKKLLDEAGMIWDKREYNWEKKFAHLEKCLNEGLEIPKEIEAWISFQREKLLDNKLDPSKIEKMERILVRHMKESLPKV